MTQFKKNLKRFGAPSDCINAKMALQMVDDIVVLQKEAYYVGPKVDVDYSPSNSNKPAVQKPELV